MEKLYIDQLFDKCGPDYADYDKILELVSQIRIEEVDEFREVMKPILNPETIIGFSFTKPFGYNGDFFIIEKIYQHYVNPSPKYRKWDEFFHWLPAAIAVVNRKELAVRILEQTNLQANHRAKDVLILGSGPVTEVFDYFKSNQGNNHLQFDLLDLDKRSIQYATTKHKNNLGFMNFFNQNVIRFVPQKTYDLIWSAGLFDYFRDKHFVFLIKKYYEFLKPGGQMIIGNFGINNPSRKIMELLGDWFLCHRSEQELVDFALQAGIRQENIEIIKEPLAINLFLKITK